MAEKATKVSPEQQLITDYQQEYTKWLMDLAKIHTDRFDRNYKQYTALTETQGTHTKISDPLAPEQVERVIQKLWERDPKFYVLARGKNLPKEITDLIASIAEYFWNNPERIQKTGPMRPKLKVVGREFCVTGNVAIESYYNQKADCPDMRIIPIEDVIFNPAMNLRTSSVYYIRQYLSVEEFQELAEIKDKQGKVLRGIFKSNAVAKIIRKHQDAQGKNISGTVKKSTITNYINRSGTNLYQNNQEEILLISRYEGAKVCRIADWEEIVQEYENTVLEDDPLDFAMDIEVPKQPYAFSMLDFINGLTHAKDLILNQIVDYGSKALNPPLFVDPNIGPINLRTVRNAFKVGGVVFAAPNQAAHQPMPNLPPVGFDLLGYLQQRAESSSGIGAYLSGVPNQVSDKTQGTKGGVLALIQQAITPVKDRQQNLEESLVEPMINKWLKMAGAVMGMNETKYAFISGQDLKWVKITKGLLTGKIMTQDLLLAELLTPDELPEFIKLKTIEGQAETGNPNYQFNPNTDFVFDVDWIVRVEAGSMAEKDMETDLEAFDGWVAFNAQYGVPMDIMKISKERALRSGLKEPEQYFVKQANPNSSMNEMSMTAPTSLNV